MQFPGCNTYVHVYHTSLLQNFKFSFRLSPGESLCHISHSHSQTLLSFSLFLSILVSMDQSLCCVIHQAFTSFCLCRQLILSSRYQCEHMRPPLSVFTSLAAELIQGWSPSKAVKHLQLQPPAISYFPAALQASQYYFRSDYHPSTGFPCL